MFVRAINTYYLHLFLPLQFENLPFCKGIKFLSEKKKILIQLVDLFVCVENIIQQEWQQLIRDYLSPTML